MNSHKGVALIQVLIITMVLTILGIFISQSIRSQVDVTLTMQTSTELELKLESAEALIIQSLLANARYPSNQSDLVLVNKWNFYGERFVINDVVSGKLQDLNGLLSVNMMSSSLATRLFAELGLEGHPVRTFLDSLRDWIDQDDLQYLNGAESYYYRSINQQGPRNGYLQSLDEVLQVKMGNILPIETWAKYFTAQMVGGFNPLTAPELILKALVVDPALVNEILALRRQKNLNYLRFYQLTGIDEDEYYNFATGNKIRVELLATSGNHRASKRFVVEVNPYDIKRPVIITDIVWNKE